MSTQGAVILALLKLAFYGSDFQSEFFRLEWSGRESLLKARLSPDKVRYSVYSDVISSSLSPKTRIFFATGTLDIEEHEHVMRLLKSLGDPVQGKVMDAENSTIWPSRRHGESKPIGLIFGATDKPDTITRILRSYISWYAYSWPFVFLIAEQEPSSWRDQVQPIVARTSVSGGPLMPDSLIRDCNLIIITEFEYSIVLFSNKMGENQLIDTASAAAIRHHLDLLVEKSKTKLK